jgi:hypothetical protein
MQMPLKHRRWFEAFQPRGIIFGFSLGLFALTCIDDYHQQTLLREAHFSPLGHGGENQVATLFLVIASCGLLLRRWWSLPIAIAIGGKVFYDPGYLSLWIYATVEMEGSWRWATWKNWFQWTLLTQPQYFLHAAVGAIICVYAAVALLRQIISFSRTRTNKPLQATTR